MPFSAFVGLAIEVARSKMRGAQEQRTEHEIGERTDRNLGGHRTSDRVSDREDEEAKLAESANHEQGPIDGGLQHKPAIHATEERDHEPQLARQKR